MVLNSNLLIKGVDCKRLIFLTIIFCQWSLVGLAEEEDKVWRNQIYKPGIRSVMLKKNGVENSMPILKLDGGTKISLSFDHLSNEIKDYQYTIQHCTPDWRASNLNTGQYIKGISNGIIQNYNHSINTYHDYVRYTVTFPSRSMKPKIAGNYILKVYEKGDEENLVLTRRFFVLNEKVTTKGQVKQATLVKYRDYKHELDFSVNYQKLANVSNPFEQIQIVLRQNQRWDNAIYGLEPSFVEGKRLVYDHQEENVFNAGNEFRPFDIRSVQYTRRGVHTLKLDSFYHAHLQVDEDRSYKSHNSYSDINGSRIITRKASNKPKLECDYVQVHFYLDANLSLGSNEGIYIFGGLTDWQIWDRFKMKYNKEEELYYNSVLLKQGYYDYKYVKASNYGTDISAKAIEGSHFETENDYTIYVYFKSPFLNTFKLVGMSRLNSGINEDD